MARARSANETSEPDAPAPDDGDGDDGEGSGSEVNLNKIAESSDWPLYHKNEFVYAKQGTAEPAAEGEEAKIPPYTIVKLADGGASSEQVEAEQFEKDWVIVKGPHKDVVPPAPRRQDALDQLIEKAAAKAAKEQAAAATA